MKSFLEVILLGIFLNGLCWQVIIPVWGYPDEQAHFSQVQDTAEIGKVIVGNKNNTSAEIAISEKLLLTERDTQGNNYFTYNPQNKIPYVGGENGLGEQVIKSLPQRSRTTFVKREATVNPPLYYKISAVFYNFGRNLDLFSRVYLVRLFSLILLLLTVFLAYSSGVLIFNNKQIAYLLAIMVGYMPMFVFASTGILTDPLTNFLMSAVIYFNLKILLTGVKPISVLLIAVLIMAGVFSRQQFLIAIPITFIAFLLRFINDKKGMITVVAVFALAAIFVTLTTLFGGNTFFIRNIMVPDTQIFQLSNANIQTFSAYVQNFAKVSYAQTFPWYWGVYKWLSLTIPNYLYVAIKILLIVSLIGVFARYLRVFRLKHFGPVEKSLTYFILTSLIYAGLFMIWDYFFQLHNGYSFGFQGRYLFPIIIAHMGIILIGFLSVVQKINSKFLGLGILTLTAFFFVFNQFSLIYVASSYYFTDSLTIFLNHLSYYKPELLKGHVSLLVLIGSLATQVLIFGLLARALKVVGKKEYNLINESDL